MTSKEISKGILKAVGTIFIIILGAYLLYIIRPLIYYILIAMIVSLIGRPIVRALRVYLKFPPTLAVASTILLLIIFSLGVISSFIPLLIAQGKNLSLLDVGVLKANIKYVIQEALQYVNMKYNPSILDISRYISINDLPDIINSLLSFLSDFGIGFLSVLFISFFFLRDGGKIMEEILKLIPRDKIENTRNSLNAIKSLLSRYFIGLILQITVLFIIYTVTLLLVGVPNAAIIAVLCALLNLIPYLGPAVSFFVIVILTMTGYIDSDFATVILPKSIYVAIGFLFAQLLDNFVNQPLIFANSVKSHPLEIFFAILAGGYLYGVIGMVIAIPAYTVIKVVLKEFMGNNKIVKSLTSRM
ncbi:AI-2E family transporter [Weeksellaceae bacterium TAE3-ERU29]|nr:AI-2E family transporter [Weeksellaceae bacterium TAE3-ERU29]